jgi:hypothetical protein
MLPCTELFCGLGKSTRCEGADAMRWEYIEDIENPESLRRIVQSVFVFTSSLQVNEFLVLQKKSYEDKPYRILDGFDEGKFVIERQDEFPLYITSHVTVLWTIGNVVVEMEFINYFPHYFMSSPPIILRKLEMIWLTRVIEQQIRNIKIHKKTVKALLKYPDYLQYITSLYYNNNDDEPQYPVPAQAEKGNHWCLNCENYGTRRCEDCQQVYYCGLECQTADWKRHKRECKRAKKLMKKKKNVQQTHYTKSPKKCGD